MKFKSQSIFLIGIFLLHFGCKKKNILDERPVTMALDGKAVVIEPFHEDLIKFEWMEITSDGKILLSDKKSIYAFDFTGKFRNRFNLEDYFEWEFCEITDFTLLNYHIFVYCRPSKKIIKLKEETLELVEVFKTPLDFSYFTSISDGFVCYQSPNPLLPDSLQYELIYLNKDFSIRKRLFPQKMAPSFVHEEIRGPKNLVVNENELFLTRLQTDTITKINEEFQVAYEIFGFPKSDITIQENPLSPVVMDEHMLFYPLFYSLNKTHEVVFFLKGETPYLAIKPRAQKDWVVIDKFTYGDVSIPPMARIINENLYIFLTDEGAISYNREKTLPSPFNKLISYENSLLLLVVPVPDIH